MAHITKWSMPAKLKAQKNRVILLTASIGIVAAFTMVGYLLERAREPHIQIVDARSYQDYVAFSLVFYNHTHADYTIQQEFKDELQGGWSIRNSAILHLEDGGFTMGIIADNKRIVTDQISGNPGVRGKKLESEMLESTSTDIQQLSSVSPKDPFAVPMIRPPFFGLHQLITPLKVGRHQTKEITMILKKDLVKLPYVESFVSVSGNKVWVWLNAKSDGGVPFGARVGKRLFAIPEIGDPIRKACVHFPFLYRLLTVRPRRIQLTLDEWVDVVATMDSGKIELLHEANPSGFIK